ncbi:MAG TPA: FAD-binding oxidoreductase, partial [Actinomycetota bacterium]|nr:FAD-binding oxidoreductase [Actinomycetota bacterium]
MRPRIKLLEFAAASRDGVARDLSGIDTGALAEDLRRVVEGEVRFEPGDRALWAHDASNFRHVPLGTVLPKHAADVTAALEVCRRYQAPVFPRGAGTSLSGQTNNGGVCFDFSKYMTEIIEINASERWARVQPGVILDHLRDAAEEFGLTFGPDPSTHSRCVMGGVLGNDSCGVHSVMAGKAVDNVIELDVVLYDGTRMTLGKTPEDRYERTVAQGGREAEIYTRLKALGDRYGDEIRKRYPDIPRRVSGYNLDDLLPERDFNLARALVGSEGTCAFILEAKVRLVPSPPHRSLLVAGYETIYQAADHVVEIMKAGPIGLEALDGELIEFALRQGMNREEISLLPKDCGGYLMIEFGGQSIAEADAKAAECERMLNGKEDAPVTQLFDDPGQERKLWDVREAGLGATAFVPGRPDAWPGWEDAAVDPSGLGGYLREFQQLLDTYDYDTALYGHFGQGCVHCRLPFDLRTASGIQKYRAFLEEAADLCLKYNGSLSGEHGDGQQRGELLPKMFGEELMDAFREFKFIWDPDWKMNPGKLIDAKPLDANLKLGTNYNPPNSKTYFTYRNEGRSFSRAALRCVGIGKCRRTEGGTMCPS